MGANVRGITLASLLAAAICALAPGAALAVPDTLNAYDITIVSSGTTTVPFDSLTHTYLADADDEVITVSDLQEALHAGPVTISANTGSGDEEGGINFDAPVTTPAENSNSLTLEPGPPANGAGVQFLADDGPGLGGNLIIDGGGESFAPIAGSGGLVMNGPGTFQLDASDTYGGSTTINAGTLQTDASAAIPSTSDVTIANTTGATLDLFGFSQTIGSLSGGGAAGGLIESTQIQNGQPPVATLTTGGDNATTTYAGTIEDFNGVALTKTGSGTFTLGAAGTYTYTGATKLDDGMLSVQGNIEDSAVTLDGGELDGTGSVDGIVGSSDTATFGEADLPGIFTSTGPATFGSGDTALEYLDSAAVAEPEYGQFNNTSGSTALGGMTLDLSAAPGFAPTVGQVFTVVDDNGSSTPVSGTFAGMPNGFVTTFPNARMQIGYGDNVTLTDIGAAATTALQTSNTSPVSYGTPVTLTATVSTGSPNTDTPSGSVTFKDGSQTLGTAPLSGDTASITTTDLPAGKSNVTAVYSGDSVFATSTSSPVAEDMITTAPYTPGPPSITGTAKAGSTLTCRPGAWQGDPSPTFTYQWSIETTPLAGATGVTFRVPSIDEGTTLVCAVTATNLAGSATAVSTGVKIPVPKVAGCPAATGAMSGTQIGQLKLGMTRTQARKAYSKHTNRGKQFQDFFCLTPMGVRAGYPSPVELNSLPKSQRAKFKNRVIWISTSNPFYAFDGVRAGESLALAQKVLHTSAPIKVGKNLWYLARTSSYTIVLKVRAGVAQELGVATNALTKTRAAETVLMHSFS
jgi:autotransporter-associated beta strand protein